MTTMITELYDALEDAGAAEDKARKAAETVLHRNLKHRDGFDRAQVDGWLQFGCHVGHFDNAVPVAESMIA